MQIHPLWFCGVLVVAGFCISAAARSTPSGVPVATVEPLAAPKMPSTTAPSAEAEVKSQKADWKPAPGKFITSLSVATTGIGRHPALFIFPGMEMDIVATFPSKTLLLVHKAKCLEWSDTSTGRVLCEMSGSDAALLELAQNHGGLLTILLPSEDLPSPHGEEEAIRDWFRHEFARTPDRPIPLAK